ncbi:MAG TPA: DNA polymerase [Polyangiaceae bacterium]|nr:DNA polymerase [Polyangiaceae bacterium]
MDFETYTDRDFTLTKMSTRSYLADARFRVLGVSIALGAGAIEFFYAGAGDGRDLDAARACLANAADDGRMFAAHNVGFDGLVAKLHWGIDFVQYFDTQGYVKSLGLKGTLDNGAKFLGHSKLSAPPFTEETLRNPSLLLEMARYCATDTAIARQLLIHAIDDIGYLDLEFEINDQTTRTNLRGLHVDIHLAAEASHKLSAMRANALSEFATKFDFNTTDLFKRRAVLSFVLKRWGIVLPSLDKRDAELAVVVESNPELQVFMRLRERIQTLGKAVGKLEAYAAVPMGIIYNFIHYFGSHTGRFSAGHRDSEKLNIHQLYKRRNGAKIPELADERNVVVPRKARWFVAADLSMIEARLVAWVAGERELLVQFRSGADVYIWFVQPIFPDLTIVKDGENGHLRDLGKQAMLGLGFGMGMERFVSRVLAEVPGAEIAVIEQVFRAYQQRFPAIRALRKELFRAFRNAVVEGKETVTPKWSIYLTTEPASVAPTVVIYLPTGRRLYYRSVRYEQELGRYGPNLAFWYAPSAAAGDGVSAKASGPNMRRFADGQYRTRVIEQTVVENLVQATARDLMVAQAVELERAGIEVAFHAHDEIVGEAPACTCPTRSPHDPGCPWVAACFRLAQIMSSVPPVLGRALSGLPVACDVKSNVGPHYAA